jgi:hypothetical protein
MDTDGVLSWLVVAALTGYVTLAALVGVIAR